MKKRGSFTGVELVIIVVAVAVVTYLGVVSYTLYRAQETVSQKAQEKSEKEKKLQNTQTEILPTANKPTSELPTSDSQNNQIDSNSTSISSDGSNASSGSAGNNASIDAPATFNITVSNDGKSLTASAEQAKCGSGATKYYAWKANDTAWVKGAEYETVTYSLSRGQSVKLQVAVRCQKGDAISPYTLSDNAATFVRGGGTS